MEEPQNIYSSFWSHTYCRLLWKKILWEGGIWDCIEIFLLFHQHLFITVVLCRIYNVLSHLYMYVFCSLFECDTTRLVEWRKRRQKYGMNNKLWDVVLETLTFLAFCYHFIFFLALYLYHFFSKNFLMVGKWLDIFKPRNKT